MTLEMFQILMALYAIGMLAGFAVFVYFVKSKSRFCIGDLPLSFCLIFFWPSAIITLITIDRGWVLWRKK